MSGVRKGVRSPTKGLGSIQIKLQERNSTKNNYTIVPEVTIQQ